MVMELAFCGLSCADCPAFIAKRTNDDTLRIRTAKEWAKVGFVVSPDKISCDGCHSGGTLLKHCDTCLVRKCGQERALSNCAECEEYPCGKLENLWIQLHAEQAKQRLDALHKAYIHTKS